MVLNKVMLYMDDLRTAGPVGNGTTAPLLMVELLGMDVLPEMEHTCGC